jgi:hypothetical protein
MDTEDSMQLLSGTQRANADAASVCQVTTTYMVDRCRSLHSHYMLQHEHLQQY